MNPDYRSDVKRVVPKEVHDRSDCGSDNNITKYGKLVKRRRR